MTADPRRVKELFVAALDQADPQARQALLDRECGGDSDLRRRLDVLLAAHDRPDSGLERPFAPAGNVTIDAPADAVGTVVAGRYKLLEEIGEGGMGHVWMAEQVRPVKRLVALKLIKPGMDSKAVLARFEAERQALALMDHPNIAKVLDGGTTEQGRPYFVMELVKGLPLTEYCDDRRLSVRDRLDLFVQVCQAVQHAHQKGVIHRDLKPSNILVTEHDGRPVPKVIDFGLAKALHGARTLTERTLHTSYGTVVGTPSYMAPEQVGINALDVDTRSDIYALGVILFELLTGTTPVEKKRLHEAAWEEMRRLIREEEPPRPSVRLSSSRALPSLAAQRRVEPAQLSRLVRGELDWIVLKALEKDRNRRYETANGLALDVLRHLGGEPVLAVPPSAAYKLRKFVRKYRAGLTVAALCAGLVVGGALVTGWQAVRARRAERQAVTERDRATAAAEAERQAKQQAEAARQQAMDALRATTDEVVERLIGAKPELGPAEREFLEAAVKRWQAFAAEAGESEQARAIRAEGANRVAALRERLGQHEETVAGYRKALGLWGKLVADFPAVPEYRRGLAASHSGLGSMFFNAGRLPESEEQDRQALALRERLVADFPTAPEYRRALAVSHNNLGIVLGGLGRRAEAEAAFRRAVTALEPLAAEAAAAPKDRQSLADYRTNLGVLLNQQGKHREAEAELRQAVAIDERLAGEFPTAPWYRSALARVLTNRGAILHRLERHAEAEAECRRGIALLEGLVADYPAIPRYRGNLAALYHNLGNDLERLGKRPEAEAEFRKAVAANERLAAEFPGVVVHREFLGNNHRALGALLRDMGKFAEAEAEYRHALAVREKLVADSPATPAYRRALATIHEDLGHLLSRMGRKSEAEAEHRQALALRQKLAADFPAAPEYRAGVGRSYNDLGLVLANLGRRAEAEAEHRRGLAVQERLVADHPGVPEYRISLGGSQCNIGKVLRSDRRPEQALEWYARAIATLEAVRREVPSNATAREFLSNSYGGRAQTLASLRRYAESTADWDKAIELTPERRPSRMGRALSRVMAGQVEAALREADELAKDADANTLYNAACVYALAAARGAPSAGPRAPESYAARAVEFLRQAVAKGYKDVGHMKADDDLAALRDRDDFRALLAELEKPAVK